MMLISLNVLTDINGYHLRWQIRQNEKKHKTAPALVGLFHNKEYNHLVSSFENIIIYRQILKIIVNSQACIYYDRTDNVKPLI